MFGVNGWSEEEGVHVAECFNGRNGGGCADDDVDLTGGFKREAMLVARAVWGRAHLLDPLTVHSVSVQKGRTSTLPIDGAGPVHPPKYICHM